MANLIVVGFKNNITKATDVLNKLRQMDDDWIIHLTDAIAVHIRDDGELVMDQRFVLNDTVEGAAAGGLLGSLVTAILAVPFVVAGAVPAAGIIALGAVGGGAVGATVAFITDDWKKEGFGISEEFIREVGSTIQPGDSAIFAFLSGQVIEIVHEFEGLGGTVLATTLNDEEKTKIEEVLNRAHEGVMNE